MNYIDTLGMNPTNELPEYYWNVKSQEQRIYLICCKIEEIKELFNSEVAKIEALEKKFNEVNELFEEAKKELAAQQTKFETKITTEFKKLSSDFSELEKQYQEFKEHGFDDYYKKQVQIWIEQNLEYIWENITCRVIFALTGDGYFCAYVPESYNDIEFSTGNVYGSAEYGHLILNYD